MIFSRRYFPRTFILQKHPLFFAIFGAEFFQDFSAVNHLTHPKFVEDLRRTKMERQQQRLEERIHRLLMRFGKNFIGWDKDDRDMIRDAPAKMVSFFLSGIVSHRKILASFKDLLMVDSIFSRWCQKSLNP